MQNQMQSDSGILFTNSVNISPSDLLNVLRYQQSKKLELTVPASKMLFHKGRLHILGALYNPAGVEGVTAKRDFNLEPTIEFIRGISQKYDIPAKYRDKMLQDEGHLLDANLNYWMNKEATGKDKLSTIRTFIQPDGSGYARCMMSDQYGFIDNLDSVTALMKIVSEYNTTTIDPGKKLEVAQCKISPRSMYVLVTTAESGIKINGLGRIYKNPETGERSDNAVMGFELSNSEVGYGSFLVRPFIGLDVCDNGHVWKKYHYKRTHRGSRIEEGAIVWGNEVKSKHAQLEVAKVTQVIQEFCSEKFIGKRIEEIETAINTPISDPVNVFKNMVTLGFSESECDAMHNLFAASGGSMNVFNVAQSVNFLAHKQDNADKVSSLQVLAGSIVESPAIITRIDKQMNLKRAKVNSVFN